MEHVGEVTVDDALHAAARSNVSRICVARVKVEAQLRQVEAELFGLANAMRSATMVRCADVIEQEAVRIGSMAAKLGGGRVAGTN